MHDLTLTDNKFDANPYWEATIFCDEVPPYETSDLFDQNGYDLCLIEKMYSSVNRREYESHRAHRFAIRQAWFEQPYKEAGAVLNHSLLFERKGFQGAAREQLFEWAKIRPVFYKLINIRPKWGLDFSMDYYDREGNTLEVLHWEYDSFDYDDINEKKLEVEQKLISIDWDDAAKEILKRKDEWYHLDFFKQSDYKCNYFGIGPERWKMVVWS